MIKTIEKAIVETIKNKKIDRKIKLKKLNYMAKIIGKGINNLYYGKSPLVYAKYACDDEIVELLTSHGAKEIYISPQKADKLANDIIKVYHSIQPEEPLLDDCKEQIVDLMERGANLNLIDTKGWPLLNIAIVYQDINSVSLMIENGAEVNLCDNHNVTPLIRAVKTNNVDIVKTLLENKLVDIEAEDSNQTTALMIAVKREYVEIAEMLVESGADVNHVCDNKETYLYWAVIKRNPKLVKMLIEKGANREDEKIRRFILNYGDAQNEIAIKHMLSEKMNIPNIKVGGRDL